MATPNAIAVALFNSAAGGYTAQIAADPNSLANAIGLILEKDISTDALFVDHLLSNFGVTTSMSVYGEARSQLFNLVASQGRGKAVVMAIDFLKTQEGAWNDYAAVALNFAVKVSEATYYSSKNPTQRDITKLVSGVTGIDTDQIAIAEALTSTNPAFSASLQSAIAAANTAALTDKTAALAAQKATADAAAKVISDKAAADLKAAQEKFNADALAAKAIYDKVISDTAATLKAANNLAVEASLKADYDKLAAAAAVDKTADNAAAVTAFLKTTAATLGLTGYESMTDTQLVNIIKYSDNQTTAAAVDKTTDNAATVTAYLKSTASNLGVSGFNTMTDSQLVTAIRTSNDVDVAAAVDRTTDNGAAITSYLRNTVTNLGVAGSGTMTDTQLINAIKLSNDVTVTADLTNRINELTTLTGKTSALSLDNDSILAVSGGNDSITATNLTYGTNDLVVDTSLSDNDVLTLSTEDDISASPVIVGIENFNVIVTSNFAGNVDPAILSFNADNLRNSKLNFSATNNNQNISTELVVTNLPILVPVTSSSKFTKVSISADDNAVVNYTGFATNLTLDSAVTLTDVFATVSATTAGTVTTDSDTVATITTSADTTVTAAAADTVRVTSGGQATVVANAANTVSVTATEEAIITANAAETITFVTGDGIDTLSASAIDSTITSTNANTITVNVAGNSASTIVDITGAPNVDRVNVTGTQNVTLKVSLFAIDGLGTATTGTTADDNVLTVIKGNSGTTNIWIKTTGGDADFSSAIVSSVIVGAALGATDDLTVASGALIVNAADQLVQDLDIIAKNSTAANNSVQIAVQDNAAAGVTGHLTGGLKLTTFATATLTNNDANGQATLGPVAASGTALTIASGTQGFTETSSINLNTANLTVTGSGAVNLGNDVTAGAILGSSALGPITIGLKGLDFVGNVTTGSGNDELRIYSAVRNANGIYTLSTGAGTDTVNLAIAQSFSWNAGADYDTLKLEGDLDLNSNVISLTNVDEIRLDSLSGGSKTVTINSDTFRTNTVFNLRGNTTGTDVLIVQGVTASETINANQVAVDPNFAALRLNGGDGNDTITGSAWADTIYGGSGNDLLSGGELGDTYIYYSGDADAGETIIEPTTGSGIDTISMLTSTIFSNMIASSFDDIEAITLAASQTATFTGLQLTGEVIALSGAAGTTETLTINMTAGQQFTSSLTNAAADIDLVYLNGSTGDENIAGGAMVETITGGTGNDTLAGGAGADTFVFSTYTTNGLDRITLGVTGLAIDDKLNFSVDLFNREATVQIGRITENSITGAIATDSLNDNVLILPNVYFADAAALVAATTTFDDIAAADCNVLIIYASSNTSDARIAFATVTNAGDINAATDIAVLVGMTIGNANTFFAIGNFIL